MKKTIFFIASMILLFGSTALKAQSISDLFSSTSVTDVVASVTGGTTLSSSNVTGEWNYVSPAVELSSDSVLTSAAGAVATSQIESELSDLCTKVGIEPGTFAFVFNDDLTFTSNVKSRDLSGTYTIDSTNSQITLKYSALGTISIGTLTADTTLIGDSMSLLFNADKLLSLISAIGSISSNESVQLLSSLAEQYDGVKLGFELATESTVEESTTSAVESAVSAISKWF
ncbi:MAG: DUF4923 family protein [Rikenellaceae bacterium]